MSPRFESSDEGEIIESGAEDSKATSLPKPGGSSVDRKDRPRDDYSRSNTRSRSRSPARYRRSYTRSRSPDRLSSRNGDADLRRSRSPRGLKRPRQPSGRDLDYRPSPRDYRPSARSRGGRDPRHFHVRYEDSLQYDDEDRRAPRSSMPVSRYGTPERDDWSRDGDRRRDDRNRPRARDRSRDRKRPRNRSRSPPRSSARGGGGYRRDDRGRRGLGFDDGRSDRAQTPKYGDHGARTPRDQQWSSRAVNNSNHVEKLDAKAAKGPAGESRHSRSHSGSVGRPARDAGEPMQVDPDARKPAIEEPQPEPEPEPEVEEEPVDIEAEIERRRRRRDELLAKSRAETASPFPATRLGTPLAANGHAPSALASEVASPRGSTPGIHEGAATPTLEIANDQELVNTHGRAAGDEDGPSAADYDPTADMKEDGLRDEARHGKVMLHGEAVPPPEREERQEDEKGDDEGDKNNNNDNDDDDDNDDFDMFAEDFDEDKYAAPKAAAKGHPGANGASAAPAQANGGILEGDDKDGYYKLRIGEVLNGRYQIESALGRGMFSGVARAKDVTTGQQVAIKIMRNNDALRKGGFTEIAILQKINKADPESRRHVVKFERNFDHKGHLCMVFESLSLNLREVLRKFGNNVGLNLVAVRVYARQMFIGLAHMKACSIIHADLKPDNILVSENRNTLKICDLGTAIDRSDAATAHNEVSPYLISRFYRAPEIILGMPYDYAVDTWSIGCTLYELYTGKILFTGESNNQMLKAMMEIRGKISSKLYKRGQLAHQHFDEKGNFISVERDRLVPGKSVVKILPVVKPTRDLRTRLVAASSGMSDDETRSLNHFVDLLERCLSLNPDKRISPSEALKHPFFHSHAHAPRHR